MKERLSKHVWLSVAIVFLGFAFQAITWLIMFGFIAGRAGQPDTWIDSVMTALTIPWFLLPLVSIVGIYSGVAYQRRHQFSFFASAGVIMNLLWLAAFLLVVFLVFVLGVTA